MRINKKCLDLALLLRKILHATFKEHAFGETDMYKII